jgi:hypothetical protein
MLTKLKVTAVALSLTAPFVLVSAAEAGAKWR